VADTTRQLVVVGSYTAEASGKGTGVAALWRNTDAGVTPADKRAMPSPSWLTWHPSVPVLYAVNETERGAVTRSHSAQVEPERARQRCHRRRAPVSGRHGRHLLCANYTGGSRAVFALDDTGLIVARADLVKHDGAGPNAKRQEAAHVHMIVPGVDADGSVIVSAVDLGTDEIRKLPAEDGLLTHSRGRRWPPGTGPRQLAPAGWSANSRARSSPSAKGRPARSP
jgi:6-phosphogluconolactonase (cycloisomerase 2 family)